MEKSRKTTWLPAEVNILLTAVKMHGQTKGIALSMKRLKRSSSSCSNKYYNTIEKMALNNKPAPINNKPAPKLPAKASNAVSGPEFTVTKGKIVAKGDNLIVVQRGKEYILITL